jgi:hypothetical protein
MPFENPEIQKMLDEERAKLEPEKIAALEATEAMKAMLAVPEKTTDASYEFGGIKIKHHRFLTKRVRLIMGQIQKKIAAAEDPVAEQDAMIYKMLSELCVEDPWTSPDSWKLVDLKTNDGRVYAIFCDLMLKMGGDEKNLKSLQSR